MSSYADEIEGLQELVGRTVLAVAAEEPGEHFLRLTTDDGDRFVTAIGDCCSETWFADITGFDALIGSPVLSVDQPALEDRPNDGRGRQEEDAYYGITITTAKGRCDIVYRNSSNGYYGGWCSYGKTCTEKVDWAPITSDWSAS